MMAAAQSRRPSIACCFMVDLLEWQIARADARAISLPPSGRAVLGEDLNCSGSRWGAAPIPVTDALRDFGHAYDRSGQRRRSGVVRGRSQSPQYISKRTYSTAIGRVLPCHGN